jgi:23S rRNA pseudouridine1911/1915/1917 synthase
MQKPAREQGRNDQLESLALPILSDRPSDEMQKPAREQGRNDQLENLALPNGRAFATNDRVGIVHRLDKDTSGLIVVAKNQEIHEALSEQFRDRTVQKKYVALVHGSIRENSGTIERRMARDRWHRTKMTVAANGREAVTLWKVRTRFEKFTLLDVEIKTGRTHQIRVHLASLNHPVVGDETYNEGRDNTINDTNIRNGIRSMNRFFLHSAYLSFTHPQTDERLTFTSELPEELAQLLKIL